jgi:phage virion morphogenesis protein
MGRPGVSDRFEIDLQGEHELFSRIDDAVRRLGDPRTLFETIGAALEANIQRRFDTKTAPDGSRWLPLSDSTSERYRQQYGGSVPGSLLERTRLMRNSLSSNATAQWVEVGFSRLADGGRYNLAALHELGTRHMPRRQLLTDDPVAGTLGTEDRQDILAVLQLFLDGLL